MLFLVCAELLALALKSNQNIQGIPIEDFVKLLGQYPDDADIFQLKNQRLLDATFDVLERFKKSSGFTLNYDKTSIFRIGSAKNSKDILLTQKTVAWTNKPINVLGVVISNKDTDTEKLNFESIYTKMKAILINWSGRSASLLRY